MLGIGLSEMIIICVVALLVFGPDELPQIVKKIARGVGEARKVTDDLRRSIDLVDDEEEDRRSRAFARSQQQVALAERPFEPEVVPGSVLTPAHGDDAPVIAVPPGAVAVGVDEAAGDAGEDAGASAPVPAAAGLPNAHGADGEAAPALSTTTTTGR
jgi:sec-independent protein translocase protein TatB